MDVACTNSIWVDLSQVWNAIACAIARDVGDLGARAAHSEGERRTTRFRKDHNDNIVPFRVSYHPAFETSEQKWEKN